jgi:hypothetical protein
MQDTILQGRFMPLERLCANVLYPLTLLRRRLQFECMAKDVIMRENNYESLD